MKKQYDINTQKGAILHFLGKYSKKWFLVSDFDGSKRLSFKRAPFIGYKASTRLAELQKEGLVQSRWSALKTEKGTALKEYSIVLEDDK